MEIKISNVSFSYGNNIVFDNFSCLVKDGLISAIVGKSGSGKSTLLNLIGGFSCFCGTITFGSLNNYKIGYLFQNSFDQVFNSSVYMEMEFGLKMFKCSDIDLKIREAIKLVGLDESYLPRNPYELSYGECRKVMLASILAYDPDVIVLDNPSVGLDNKSKNELIKLLKSLKKDYNKTIIIVSNDINFLHRFVDYVYLLKDGKICLEGGKYDVFSNEEKMNECGLFVPNVLHFSNIVKVKKNVNIGYRDEINDLIKDVYRYAKW